MLKIEGIPASTGIAIGKVNIYRSKISDVFESHVALSEVPLELSKFKSAVDKSISELNEIYNSMSIINEERARVFLAHIEILRDNEILKDIQIEITHNFSSAEWAVNKVFNVLIDSFSLSSIQLVKDKVEDLVDIRKRLICNILSINTTSLSNIFYPSIIVSDDLTPSDTAVMDKENVLAIISENGSLTSHCAVIAKGYGIPAILGVPNATNIFTNEETVIVDATKGYIYQNPSPKELTEYRNKQRLIFDKSKVDDTFADKPCITKDGTKINIGINIDNISENDNLKISNCDMCGLFRTEFIYMNSLHIPTQDEQFHIYKHTLELFKDKPVTLRTLDIGGDKSLSYLNLPREDNPFLGNRAIRFCFDNKNILLDQLTAALRASLYGNLKIMFPMITSIDDINMALNLLNEAKDNLENAGIPFDKYIKIGIMIEVPSIALMSDKVSELVDFASIGSNDLCQYLSAADRLNPSVTKYYDSALPSMLRLISFVSGKFNDSGKDISICGELGSDDLIVPILIGLGIHNISMGSSSIPRIKHLISKFEIKELTGLSNAVLSMSSSQEIKAYMLSQKKQKAML